MKPLITNTKATMFSTLLLLLIFSGLSFAAITNTPQDLIIPAGETFTICGSTSYTNSVQIDGTLIVKAYDGTLNAGWIEINSPSIAIGVNGIIDANGKGYRANEGPGAGLLSPLGGGAGYGGYCGYPGGPSYGSITQPNDLGSGGGSSSDSGKAGGGPGGGKIKLLVSGTLTNNGSITANGAAGYYAYKGASGGGSGGTIYITANNIAGNGIMTANGGKGFVNSDYNSSGSGAGGRIAIYSQSNDYSGTINACGGNTSNGIKNGGAGTVYKKLSSQTYGELLISDASGGGKTYISGQFDKVIISSFSAVVSSGSLTTIEFNIQNSSFTNTGSITINTFNLNRGATFYQEGSFTAIGQSQINGMFYADAPVSMWNTKILVGGIITHNIRNSNFNMNVGNNLEIMPGGRIDVSGKGYQANEGPGTGSQVYFSGGAGYGGRGGTGGADGPGGIPYGNLTEPVELGSGGASSTGSGKAVGGAGGGKIKLVVAGTISNNGSIIANGNEGYYVYQGASGGGSGGSIYIITDRIEGNGAITANGGNGGGVGSSSGGGGAGGRVAVYYGNSSYSGSILASAGSEGSVPAEAGTVFIPVQGPDSPVNIANPTVNHVQSANISETVSVKPLQMTLDASGGLNGTIALSNAVFVMVKTGGFADKGLFKADWAAQLEGVQHNGKIKTMAYIDIKQNKLVIRGAIEGGVSGIIDGTFTEAMPNSGTYEQFNGTWTFRYPRADGQYSCGKTIIDGAASYLQSSEYPNTALSYIQTSAAGAVSGSYTGSIDAVLTNVRINDTICPYNGDGFGLFSYRTVSEEGQGWFYSRSVSSGEAELSGFIDRPLIGYLQGALVNKDAEKKLWLIISRLDIGEEPKAELRVDLFALQSVSPGQTITYSIRVKNTGLVPAQDVKVLLSLPQEARFLSASDNYYYESVGDSEWMTYENLDTLPEWISWYMDQVPAKSVKYFNVQAKLLWGLSSQNIMNAHAGIYVFEGSVE